MNKTLQRLTMTLLLVLMLSGGSLFGAGIPPAPADLATALSSKVWEERTGACEAIIATYKAATDEQKTVVRQQYEGAINSMLNAPVPVTEVVTDKEDWASESTPRNLAVRLAGELKLVSAIPRLVELLRPLGGERIKPVYENMLVAERTAEFQLIAPSARALIRMGEEAKALLEASQTVLGLALSEEAPTDKHSKEHRYRLLMWSNTNYALCKIQAASSGDTNDHH